MASPSTALSDTHATMLYKESAIAPEVIERRGYRTVTTKAELKSLGFGVSQLLVPTLLLPIWGVSGDIVGYQSRPDSPRVKDGKPVKYETPVKLGRSRRVPAEAIEGFVKKLRTEQSDEP